MSTTIRIPADLDRDAVMSVLKRLNLLETGAKSFGSREISAALRWARVPLSEGQRFLNAVEKHDLFWKVRPGALRRMKATLVLTRGERLLMTFVPGETA